jgi:hypothetical protein
MLDVEEKWYLRAGFRRTSRDFLRICTVKSETGQSREGAVDRSKGGAMRGPRLSIAGLMTLVGVIALDCAILVHVSFLWDQSPAMAVCLLIDVLPLITGTGVIMLLALQPPARRSRRTRHLPLSGAGGATAAGSPDPAPADSRPGW